MSTSCCAVRKKVVLLIMTMLRIDYKDKKAQYTQPSAVSSSQLARKYRLAKKVGVKDETIKALMYIEYGHHWGFTVNELLRHEPTSSVFFLVNQDGYVRKRVSYCSCVQRSTQENQNSLHRQMLSSSTSWL